MTSRPRPESPSLTVVVPVLMAVVVAVAAWLVVRKLAARRAAVPAATA